jgi:leucyl aminopeptidase (aminopeptidase T)
LIERSLREIFRVNLGVKKHERVLLFNDRISQKETLDISVKEQRTRLRSLSLLAAEIGKRFCASIIHHEYTATGSHGSEPPLEIWRLAFGARTVQSLKRKKLLHRILKKTANDAEIGEAKNIIQKYKKSAIDCVVALSHYSTSHTRFRDFLTTICGTRYASMPLFDVAMLEGVMNVHWKSLAKITRNVAKIVQKADFVEITSPNGTFLSFSKKGRKTFADTGILTKPGSFGNLPAGEAFLAPVEGTSSGKLVIEWAPTRELDSPLTLSVKDGYVVDISGNDPYNEFLKMKLAENKFNGSIAEFGIGTNSAAKRPDNILESEKILGTIHIALGDNSSFGGNVKTPFHQDFVFFKPTITLIHADGTKKNFLRDGKLLIETQI